MKMGLVRAVVVAHAQKVAVADLLPDADKSNPPLSPKGVEEARATLLALDEPQVIFCSPRLRCLGMIDIAYSIWGRDIPSVFLRELSQPDNLDADGQIYGTPSTPDQWGEWAQLSHGRIVSISTEMRVTKTVLVLTHRPILAAMVALVEHSPAVFFNPGHYIDPTDPRFKAPVMIVTSQLTEIEQIG